MIKIYCRVVRFLTFSGILKCSQFCYNYFVRSKKSSSQKNSYFQKAQRSKKIQKFAKLHKFTDKKIIIKVHLNFVVVAKTMFRLPLLWA